MKTLLLLTCLLAATVAAQTIHEVPPDTRGNVLALSITNASVGERIEGIQLTITRGSGHLAFGFRTQTIDAIPPAKDVVVSFPFDVARSAPVGRQDTLEMQIMGKHGLLLTRSMIVRYAAPASYALDQNFPNPFNPVTRIQYQLPVGSYVKLKVYDVLGREVETLLDEVQEAGFKDVQFDATGFASGVYFYRIEAKSVVTPASFWSVRKFVVVK